MPRFYSKLYFMNFLRNRTKSLPERFQNVKSLQFMPDSYFICGRQVRVINNLEYVRFIQNKKGGGWTQEMKECLNKICTVSCLDPDALIRVKTETGKEWFFHKASLESIDKDENIQISLGEKKQVQSLPTFKSTLSSSFSMNSPPVTLTPPKEISLNKKNFYHFEASDSTLDLPTIHDEDSLSSSFSMNSPPVTLTPPKEISHNTKNFYHFETSDTTLDLLTVHDEDSIREKNPKEIWEQYFSMVILGRLTKIYENINVDKNFLIGNKLKDNCEIFNKVYQSAMISCAQSKLALLNTTQLAIDCVITSLNIFSRYAEYKFDNQHIPFDDLEICKLFTGLDGIKSECVDGQRLCEAILYAMCNAFKLSAAKINRKFWFDKMQNYNSDEKVSRKIKLFASIILIHTGKDGSPLDRSLMDSLMNIELDGNEYDLEFSKDGILFVLAIGITNHLQHYKGSFLSDGKESNLQLNYQMSCKLIKVGYVQKEYYENAIANYSMINIKIFKDEFIKILRETVTPQMPLEDNEKTILNIMCNTFTICGQFNASLALAPHISDIFAAIMEYLKILQPIASGNMIASRISEIILYCLCNIAQKDKLNDKRGWRPILYGYYIGSKHSTEIKIASAVSISLLLTNAESKEKYKIEMEKIKEYLNDITKEMISDKRCNYFGFTQDEIEEALACH